MSSYAPEEVELLVAFGLRVRDQRLRKNLSQEELADVTSLHRTYIGSVERGERNLSLININKIAAALDIETQKLLVDGCD